MMTSVRSVGGRAGKRNFARPRTSCRAAPPSRRVSCGCGDTGLAGAVRPPSSGAVVSALARRRRAH